MFTISTSGTMGRPICTLIESIRTITTTIAPSPMAECRAEGKRSAR